MKTIIISMSCLVAGSGFAQETQIQWIQVHYSDSSAFIAEWYQDTAWQHDRTHTSVVIRYIPLKDSLETIKNRYVKKAGEVYEYYASTYDWIDLDCRSERYRVCYSADYDDSGRVIRDAVPSQLAKWQYIGAGGILDSIMTKTCK